MYMMGAVFEIIYIYETFIEIAHIENYTLLSYHSYHTIWDEHAWVINVIYFYKISFIKINNNTA